MIKCNNIFKSTGYKIQNKTKFIIKNFISLIYWYIWKKITYILLQIDKELHSVSIRKADVITAEHILDLYENVLKIQALKKI